jgi:PKD repeat protein
VRAKDFCKQKKSVQIGFFTRAYPNRIGSAPVTLTPSSSVPQPNLQPHTFTKAGNHNVTLTATATDPGNDTLTYNWYLNNATTPITGQTINYAFADNGIYPVKLDVIDSNGAITTQSVNVTVNNIAPVIVSIDKPTTIHICSHSVLSGIDIDFVGFHSG